MKAQFAAPGFDPTSEDLPDDLPAGPKLSGCLLGGGIGLVLLLLLGGVLVASVTQVAADDPLPTLLPTETVAPATYTPYPTYTPPPTWTPAPNQPTWTPAPTNTPAPTATQTPIPPGMVASWTPGPWMLTRFAEGEKKR